MNHRDADGHGRVIQGVARLERVGPIEDDVVAVDEAADVLVGQHLLVEDDVDVGIECVDRAPRRLGLLLAYSVRGMDDLALEIRQVDDVEVDHADRSNAGRREIEGRR